jgi:hypothetical protein
MPQQWARLCFGMAMDHYFFVFRHIPALMIERRLFITDGYATVLTDCQ